MKTISKLTELPNVGPKIASKLRLIGIKHPSDLIGKNPQLLYQNLCEFLGEKVDLCVLDTFMSVVHFMDYGEAFPWWYFTEKRKTFPKKDKIEINLKKGAK